MKSTFLQCLFPNGLMVSEEIKRKQKKNICDTFVPLSFCVWNSYWRKYIPNKCSSDCTLCFQRRTELHVDTLLLLFLFWYNKPPIHGIVTPYPWYFDTPTHGISIPISMVFVPLSMEYLTLYQPMVFWPPNHGISNPLPMFFCPPYPWYIHPQSMVIWPPYP